MAPLRGSVGLGGSTAIGRSGWSGGKAGSAERCFPPLAVLSTIPNSDRYTDGQTDNETDRQTDKQTATKAVDSFASKNIHAKMRKFFNVKEFNIVQGECFAPTLA